MVSKKTSYCWFEKIGPTNWSMNDQNYKNYYNKVISKNLEEISLKTLKKWPYIIRVGSKWPFHEYWFM